VPPVTMKGHHLRPLYTEIMWFSNYGSSDMLVNVGRLKTKYRRLSRTYAASYNENPFNLYKSSRRWCLLIIDCLKNNGMSSVSKINGNPVDERGRDSSVSRATGWTVRDRLPVGARFFAHVQTGPGGHLASCTMGTGYFSGVKRSGRGVDHPPLVVPRSRKSRAIPPPLLWAFGSVRGTFTFTFTQGRPLGGASGTLAPGADFEGAPKRRSPTGHTLIRSTVAW
jgi:hypothetical protein